MAAEVITVGPGDGLQSADFQAAGRKAAVRAAAVLNAGGLVAFPTETVYGLGVRADQEAGLRRFRRIKDREASQPMTVHVAHPDVASDYVVAMPPLAGRLMRRSWPGPLTIIVATGDLSATVALASASDFTLEAICPAGTVGLRCPANDIAREVLRLVDGPVVASSANARDHAPPRDGDEMMAALEGADVDLVIAAGPTRYSKASTIVRVTGEEYEILREGVLDRGVVDRLMVLTILFVCTGNTCRSPMAEGLAKKMIADRLGCDAGELSKHRIKVKSAGTSGGFGGASSESVNAMRSRGIDISNHVSSPLSGDDINQADHIFVMTRSHLEAVRYMAPDADARTSLLIKDDDVLDPIGGSATVYEECAVQIERGVRVRLEEIEL